MYFIYTQGNNRKNIYPEAFPRRQLIKGLHSEVRTVLNEASQRWHHDHTWPKRRGEEVTLLEPGRAGLGRGKQGSR